MGRKRILGVIPSLKWRSSAQRTGTSQLMLPPCLAIQEIFEEICRHLYIEDTTRNDWSRGKGRAELAALARTCKTLHETALNHLWKHPRGGLSAVFAVLPQYKLMGLSGSKVVSRTPVSCSAAWHQPFLN